MTARVLMVVGTTSSAGKSLLVTALCRIYARRGVRVAPFKAQNMSNNAAVCADGAEIGRAQAVQAAAAGIEPTAQMNPLLLKPEADSRAQVVLLGRPLQTESARAYFRRKIEFWSTVTSGHVSLRDKTRLFPKSTGTFSSKTCSAGRVKTTSRSSIRAGASIPPDDPPAASGCARR
jgi:adenosylcobyric acid synthase